MHAKDRITLQLKIWHTSAHSEFECLLLFVVCCTTSSSSHSIATYRGIIVDAFEAVHERLHLLETLHLQLAAAVVLVAVVDGKDGADHDVAAVVGHLMVRGGGLRVR